MFGKIRPLFAKRCRKGVEKSNFGICNGQKIGLILYLAEPDGVFRSEIEVIVGFFLYFWQPFIPLFLVTQLYAPLPSQFSYPQSLYVTYPNLLRWPTHQSKIAHLCRQVTHCLFKILAKIANFWERFSFTSCICCINRPHTTSKFPGKTKSVSRPLHA